MRLILLLLALLMLAPAVLAEDAKKAGKPKKRPPPLPGIHWESDFEKGMAKAERQGRPILFAVNALETEQANNHLASNLYRSNAWGDASRGYVAFCCNPNEHGTGKPNSCRRYPGCDCAAHKQALDWFLARFGLDLISPQHVILEPDGDLAYRKQYFTGVVGPSLLETYLSKVAPKTAYARAGGDREARIKQLAKCPVEEVDAQARRWLDGRDGLAAAALLNVLDDSYDAARRRAVIRALRHTPGLQVPVLAIAAEERVLFPEDEWNETTLWLRTLFEADRTYGVWGATRALVRLGKEVDRNAILRIWAGSAEDESTPGIDDLPERERPAAYEALLLAKDRRANRPNPPRSWTLGREREILRARGIAKVEDLYGLDLKRALADPHPRKLRPLILFADPADVRRNLDGLIETVAKSPWFRVRVAAALRLLEIREPQGGAVVDLLVEAIHDPLERAETRAHAIRILGEDPGQSTAEWRRLMNARVKGGAK